MAKNGKGFEKFLREEAPAKSQFFRATNKSPEEEAAYQAAQRAFDLQLQRQNATTQVVTKTYTAKDKDGNDVTKTYKERVPKTDVDLTNVPSEQEVEQAFETSRKASLAVDDTKKISPSYWVTQKDFQDAFGRRYDAMSEQDRQDFFGLVGSSQPRRYTEGPAAGQVIPSTRRPDFIPTYQDVDGVRVPETALGYTQKEQEAARLSGFKTAEEAKKMGGVYSPKPDFVIKREAEDVVNLPKQMKLLGISPKPSKSESQTLPYSDRQSNPLEDPTNLLKFVQQYAPETLTAAQKAALGMEGEYRRDLPYARRAAGLEGTPPPPPAPPELLRAPEPETKKANEIPELLRAPAKRPTRREKIEATGKKQRESMETRGISVPGFDVAEKGFGQFNPLEPAPELESSVVSDLELARMKRDSKESEPSGLSQAMGLAQGVGQFAKNLDQAAGRKIRETGQKVSDIAKQFRTQRDENFRKNIERLEAKGIKVPGFDVGEKGFGQHGNYPAQGKEDFQGQLLSKSLVNLPLGPDETIEDRRKEIVQYYKEKMLPSEYAKTWGFASDEPSPELPGRFDMDPIRSKTPVTTQSFNAPQKRSSTTAPQQVAGAISGNQKKQFAQSSPISQEMASRMISVQTPGQLSTQLTGRPLTTQERDRFKFDSAVPASVAASMNKITPVRTPLGQEPLTQTEKPIGGGKKGEREMASFTKGMSDAEVNAEFEKLFGKEQRNLSTEMKKDMIERFKLGELMQEGGGIMGINPMYEMEIDPDTGELKLNPKKKIN